MKKIGVLQIIDSLHIGGAENLAVNIANELAANDVRSFLCATRAEGALKINLKDDVGYLFLKRAKIVDFRALFRLRTFLKQNNITVLHAHGTSSFLVMCIKIVCPKIKVIWHNHYGKNLNLSGLQLFFLKIESLFFAAVITVSKDLKEWVALQLYCKKVFYLTNFVIFQKVKKTTTLKGENGKRIVHLASFREEKDHETLIKAFANFSLDHQDWSLHLIGKYYNDEYSDKVFNLIKELKLNNTVFAYGSCTDIESILSQSNIGVLSSKFEGLPLALLEYGLAKLPVIVTNVGQCNAVVQNNKLGYVVETKDAIALASKLKSLASSKDKALMFAENLHNTVKENYSKENFIENLINIYTFSFDRENLK
ncbi:glycosyltransferase [uncultured Polaribacter sp.]|uniref:glycosyltransferase n=1 Tax=uncultured Polaribacter sp. TaxID=174711 RepID=UPI0026304C96|nr:glycosyltransferase [uncultured Polaribacter sp.]